MYLDIRNIEIERYWDSLHGHAEWQEKKDEENYLRSQKTDTLISVLPGIPVYSSSVGKQRAVTLVYWASYI